jgi:hypothetical protein
LFASEFNLSPAEQPEYRHLQAIFREALRPDNELLELLCGDVVACCWRLKLSLRLEQSRLQGQFRGHQETSEAFVEPGADESGSMQFPYPLTRAEVDKRIKLLDEVEHNFRYELETLVTEAFGAPFWKTLTDAQGADVILMHVIEMGLATEKTFDLEPLFAPPSAEEAKNYEAANCHYREQLRNKVLELERHHLKLQLHRLNIAVAGKSASEDATRLDLALRYAITARRQFYQALDAYFALKARRARRKKGKGMSFPQIRKAAATAVLRRKGTR